MKPIAGFKQGDKLSAAHLQDIANAINRIMQLLGWDVSIRGTDSQLELHKLIRFGVVVSAGPNGEPNFTDERYWVHQTYIFANSPYTTPSEPILLAAEPSVNIEQVSVEISSIACVHNASELYEHTHNLIPGTMVIYFIVGDHRPVNSDGTMPNTAPRYIMAAGNIPTPQYQGEVVQAVTDGHLGADYPAAIEDLG